MLKEFLKKYGYRIYISIDIGALFMGVFMTFIGAYSPICGATQNDTRMTIGAVCIAVWFIMFPTISRDGKDKILTVVEVHSLIVAAMLVLFVFETKYFLGNMERGKWYFDVLFCLGGIVVLAYFLYVLIGFMKTFFTLVVKAKEFIFPKLQKEVSGVINVIEAITAGVLSITAFGASIFGIVTLIRQFVDIF